MRRVQLSFPYTDERFLPQFRSSLYDEMEKACSVLQFCIQEDEDRRYRHFHCQGWPKEEHTILVHEAWMSALANAVRIYVSAKEEEWIFRRIAHHRCYNRTVGKARLFRYISEHIRNRCEEGEDRKAYNKHRVEQEVIAYLENHHVLQLDGFFRFRLREYIEELCESVDVSIEQYIAEEEHEALLQRLQAFFFALPYHTGLLRLVHTSRFEFTYYNEAWERLVPSVPIHLPTEVESAYIDEEAAIIAALAAFSPERIIIYTRWPSSGPIATLERVFADRITICTDFSFPITPVDYP
ncbi:sporulation protein YtxC [Aneurinibacillus migulanus]|uniref:Putative sporulation protein YtxC n=1 Tax=Aneurinibacillus migulanus TaxID=47500 RepID=A0A0D1YJR3_ANEMI|nr:sporulation protein YtxC [Aneurinibacillus migulanus]KIV58997.1 hypothetical protein TS65_03410 [Aneurinibacillus migulanus]KON99300.1 hypothetical protein AF333_00770 [Aneurinibacillus migulanus]MED0893260.1 sporulation protein YtxC [Aneurinibacillus migulanus]MED1615435.1 sporulation protein YtxC [Aneurinibacillus migulanus]MED4727585.1 sporulation protein YtxC [Aneurinibacillus migulanus]